MQLLADIIKYSHSDSSQVQRCNKSVVWRLCTLDWSHLRDVELACLLFSHLYRLLKGVIGSHSVTDYRDQRDRDCAFFQQHKIWLMLATN